MSTLGYPTRFGPLSTGQASREVHRVDSPFWNDYLATRRFLLDRFALYQPGDRWKHLIQSFAIQESVAERTHTVLPSTSLVMGFQFRGQIAFQDGVDRATPLAWNGITGLQTKARVFHSSAGVGSLLIHFKPAGARSFLRLPASEVLQQSIPLDLVTDVANLNQLEEALRFASTDQERIAAVESYLANISLPRSEDPLVLAALNKIHQRAGLIRIKGLAETLGTSLSPLERRFNDIVGTSPKKYARLVRLNVLLKRLRESPDNYAALALRMGFHDQAHFIREFKQWTGLTPKSFAEQELPIDEFLQSER